MNNLAASEDTGLWKFPKHLILIKDKVYELGNDFVFNGNLDSIYSTLELNLPYIKQTLTKDNNLFSNQGLVSLVPGNITIQNVINTTTTTIIDTTDLKKYDVVKFYYKEFDTSQERANATIDTMDLIFDGYINEINLSEEAENQSYFIHCKSTLALTYERSSFVNFYEGNIQTLVAEAFNYSGLWIHFPEEKVKIGPKITKSMIIKISGGKFFGKILDDIKDKYAIQVYQKGDEVKISFPFYLTLNNPDLGATNILYPYVFDLKTNIFRIDYGNLSKNYDCVAVFGNNVTGVAFDPIAYQLKTGVPETNLNYQFNYNDIDVTKLNTLYLYRRDLISPEECQQVARATLLEMGKNYQITIETVYLSDLYIGDIFTIKNSSKINENQIFIVKDYTLKVSDGDITVQIKGYSNSILDFPQEYILSTDSAFDIDRIDQVEKVEPLFNI